MKQAKLKTLIAGLIVLISGLFANQALAAARIVVAKSGGDYTTITAALNAISPSATNPYVIEVWPGVYTETYTVNLKSYVHLKGSGRDVTTIQTSQGTSSDVLNVNNERNIIISGFTITGGMVGIRLQPTHSDYPDENYQVVTITENTISGNTVGIWGLIGNSSSATNSTLITNNNIVNNTWQGLYFLRYPVTLIDNYISGNDNGDLGSAAIQLDNDNGTQSHDHVLMGNIIKGNNGTGIWIIANTNPEISNNVITGNSMAGIDFYSSNTGGSVTNNKIVNNGTSVTDIIVNGSGSITPNISFNMYTDITGTRGVGKYNVKPDGTDSPAP